MVVQLLATCEKCGRERRVATLQQAVYASQDMFGKIVSTSPAGAYRCASKAQCKTARKQARYNKED